jgi:Carboxypeptidase regulatory-like domain
MRLPIRVQLTTLALLLSSASLGAQGSVRGTVHDSLRTGRPVVGAEVVLLGSNRRTTTDERGRFEFADAPAGEVDVAYWAPWLDSLALPPLQARARAGTGNVTLATPSLRNYQQAVCGTTLAANEGILIGELRAPDGSPLDGVAVGARWHETLLGVGQLERRLRAALDTANASGFWALCGVPADAEFAVIAGNDTLATGEIVLGLGNSPVVRRDLTAAPAGVVATVRGRLIGPDSMPLAGATVSATGDTAIRTRTDAEGRFLLVGVPRRSMQLVARAIGFVPTLQSLEPLGDDVDLEDVLLPRLPQALATVTVTGRPMTLAQLEFDTRKARGIGQFVDEEQLSKLPMVNASNLASMMQGVRAVGSGRNRRVMLQRLSFGGGSTSTACAPRWFEDGAQTGALDAADEEALLARAKRIEVYSAAEAPARYNDFDGCGVVLIWTR